MFRFIFNLIQNLNINLRLLKHEQSQKHALTSSIVLQKNDGKSLNCILLGRTIKTFF